MRLAIIAVIVVYVVLSAPIPRVARAGNVVVSAQVFSPVVSARTDRGSLAEGPLIERSSKLHLALGFYTSPLNSRPAGGGKNKLVALPVTCRPRSTTIQLPQVSLLMLRHPSWCRR